MRFVGLITVVLVGLMSAVLAEASGLPFEHRFGTYTHTDAAKIELMIKSGAKDATQASASSLCQGKEPRSYATELHGNWVELGDDLYTYQGVYQCEKIDSNRVHVKLRYIAFNHLNCLWRGPDYSDFLSENVCARDYGLRPGRKLYGGCISGPKNNVYVFETFCE